MLGQLEAMSVLGHKRTFAVQKVMSALPPKDGLIGLAFLWIAEDFGCFRLMVKRGPLSRPQASEGEAQHGAFCRTGRVSQ